MEKLTLELLKKAVLGTAAAFRCVTEYQPAGGVGDKVFPPTYEGGKYAVEKRMIGGQLVPCVLLDSVQSQANRMELALLEAWRTKDDKGKRRIEIPVITVRFDDHRLKKNFVVTSLDVPHRAADAILRDSKYKESDGKEVIFRQSSKGKILDVIDVRNATGLFGLNPTALIFGIWDSTGPRGGLGAKFQRALVSEMVGFNAEGGKKTGSRIDPAQISSHVTLYMADTDVGYTTDEKKAKKDAKGNPMLFDRGRSGEGKPGNPSKANHSNIPPTVSDGGFTISHAVQTSVLSLAALRRLRFPLDGAVDSVASVDQAARVALAALGLTAATLAREEGADLRSRCQLFPTQKFVWELLDTPGESPKQYELSGEEAIALFEEAVKSLKTANLPWNDEIILTPSAELIHLVAKSQDLAMSQATEGGE